MNDFTKEELIIILKGILWRDNHVDPSERPEKLKCKLESMIENYCEHECNHKFERKLMQIDLCDKCMNFKFVFTGMHNEHPKHIAASHLNEALSLISHAMALLDMKEHE